MKELFLILTLSFFLSSQAQAPSDQVFFSSFYSGGSSLYAYNFSSNVTTQLYSTNYQISRFVADNTYIYFGVLWTIIRVNHITKQVDAPWLSTNKTEYGYGLIYNIALDQDSNTLYYQTQADYNLYILDLATLNVQKYARYGYNGNGGMNGQMALYKKTPTSPMTVFWGIDPGEDDCSGILELTIDGDTTADDFYCSIQFPRSAAVYNNNLYVAGGVVSTIGYILDAVTGTLKGHFNISGGYGFSLDNTTGDLYFGGGAEGIFKLDTTTLKVTTVRSSIGYNVAYVAFVKGSPPSSTPELTKITPSSGSDNGGTKVYVVGSGFVDSYTLACKFGHILSPQTVFLTDELIACETPPSPVDGTAQLTVTNDGVHFSNGLAFNYVSSARIIKQ